MLNSLVWEGYKLARRPAVWASIGILLLLAVGLGYVTFWIIYTHPPQGSTGNLPRGVAFSDLKVALYPAAYVKQTLQQWASLGGVFALILGVLSQGSEYGWGTVKTVFTQRPGRLELLAGKLAALILTVLVMALALFAVDALASLGVATLDGKSTAFPPLRDTVKGILAAWLIFSFWAVFGFTLATLFRQSAMAIGLGLAYAILIEGIIFSILASLGGDTVRQIHSWFPIANTSYLASSFGRPITVGPPPPPVIADANHAVEVLLFYAAIFILVSAVLTRRRDVT